MKIKLASRHLSLKKSWSDEIENIDELKRQAERRIKINTDLLESSPIIFTKKEVKTMKRGLFLDKFLIQILDNHLL